MFSRTKDFKVEVDRKLASCLLVLIFPTHSPRIALTLASFPLLPALTTHFWLRLLSLSLSLSLQKEQGPVRLYDFSLKYDLPNLTDPNSSLFKRFARDERVLFDEKTGLYRYKVSQVAFPQTLASPASVMNTDGTFPPRLSSFHRSLISTFKPLLN